MPKKNSVQNQQFSRLDDAEKKGADVVPTQIKEEQEIASVLWGKFDTYRKLRDQRHPQFRDRTLIEYIDGSNRRFNNYKERPAWKDEWQANISDITTHAKVMAIVAQVVATRMKPEFMPRIQRNFVGFLRSRIIQDLHDYTDTVMRNGELDLLFTALRAAREGTVIGFEGWKKNKNYEGVDAQFVPLEDFYPETVNKFDINELNRCFWRTVMTSSNFADSFKNFHNFEKVPTAGQVREMEKPLFTISNDIDDNEIEVLRYFDKLNNEYHLIANGVLLTEKSSKLSARRKDGRLGFWKGAGEPFGDDFFYGRSTPDLLQDNQDAIDFLFNAMFDKEILSVLRPLLVGGMNDLTEDYLYPGSTKQVADVDQIKELKFDGPDIDSFRILKELKDRENLVTTDQTSSGVAIGGKTATEVERAQEAARKLLSVFILLIKDAMINKTRLRVPSIQRFMIGNDKFKEVILENSLLTEGRYGTKIIRFKKDKLSKSDIFMYSPLLSRENALINGDSEIMEVDPKKIKDFEVDIKINSASSVEMSESLKRAFVDRWTTKAYQLPHIFNPEVVGRMDVEANRDFLSPFAEQLIAPDQQQGGEVGQIGAGELGNEMLPTSKAAVPKLKSLINNPV